MAPVTQRDVAEAVNVSVSTVSRVLSRGRRVSPELAAAVERASEELGYRPNYVARALRRQATQAVGVLVSRINHPFFPSIVEAAERSFQQAGFEIFLCDSQDDPALEAIRAQTLLDRRVDGLLMIPCGAMSAGTLEACRRQLPLVQLDRYVRGADADFVGIDNAAGVDLALGHVRSLGKRSLAFVSARGSISTFAERLDAYKRGAREGFDEHSPKNVLLGPDSIDWGCAAADQLVESGLPEAILCGNDRIAIGVLQSLRANRVDVPGDVAVVGFDDVLAHLGNPPLTSIRQSGEALGETAAGLLIRRLEGHSDDPRQHIRLLPSLVVRGSTVPAA